MRKLVSILTALVAVAAVLMTVGPATGAVEKVKGKASPLLLGKANKAKKTTTLTNKKAGPALSINTLAGSPPLAVNSGTKVTNLNADSVDGLDSAALVNAATRRYASTDVTTTFSSVTFPIEHLSPGSYLVTFKASLLPTGGTQSAPSNVQCQLRSATGDVFGGDMDAYIGGFNALLSGADIVSTNTPLDLTVTCASGFASFKFVEPLVVSVTQVVDGGTHPLTPAP